MPDKKLMEFLCKETAFEEIGNEQLLHQEPAFGKMVGSAINNGTLLEVTRQLSDSLQDMDLYKACLLSHFIGFACEKEENTAAGEGVITLLADTCETVYEMLKSTEVDETCQLPSDLYALYQENPRYLRAYCGLEMLCIASMAFLTRDRKLRYLLRSKNLREQIRYLAEETPSCPRLNSVYYVNRMQNTCSDLNLLVLHPDKKQGFLAVANDLDNCFHLLFLLEEQIAETMGRQYGMSGFTVDPILSELAHGAYPENAQGLSYTTFFTEFNYGMLLKNMDAPGSSQDIFSYLVWGEMPPESIPCVNEHAVIVLTDARISRSFDSSFLSVPHTALHPYVRMERELTETEYETWISRIHSLSAR